MPAVPPRTAPVAAIVASSPTLTRAASIRRTRAVPSITASSAEAPKADLTTITEPSIIRCVATTSTTRRSASQAGVFPSSTGAVGSRSATSTPKATGTQRVPGPTGALMTAALESRNTPVSTVTRLKGSPVLEAIPSSSTNRGPLPRAVPDTTR